MLDQKAIERITESELKQEIEYGELETRCDTTFTLWAESVLGANFIAAPEIRNTDDEAIARPHIV